VLGDYPQAVGAAADSLYRTATTISPEARDWVRDFLTHEPQRPLLTRPARAAKGPSP
jgi:hypothetical protein